MQKGEARESDAIINAPELCSEVQKSGGGYWTSQTRRSLVNLHRRDTFFETINQTPRVGEEKLQSDRESGRCLRWFSLSYCVYDRGTWDWTDQDSWTGVHWWRLPRLPQVTPRKSRKAACFTVHGQCRHPQEALCQRVVAEAEHGADLEHRIQSWIPTNWSCVLESEKVVQQPAAEQTCEQDGVQRRQGDWSGFQVNNGWSLPFMCEEELIFVKTCFLTRLNKIFFWPPNMQNDQYLGAHLAK